MIINTNTVKLENVNFTLDTNYINPIDIRLKNIAQGVFNVDIQIGFFETQEKAYLGSAMKLNIDGFPLNKQHLIFDLPITIFDSRYFADLYKVDALTEDYLLQLFGWQKGTLYLVTKPLSYYTHEDISVTNYVCLTLLCQQYGLTTNPADYSEVTIGEFRLAVQTELGLE